MNLLSLSLRNLRRLILAWLCCMRASARESRVSVVIHSFDVVGRPGLHQSGLVSTCFADCSSPGPRKNDLTNYWALGPFVRPFTSLVDPGDIYPPQAPDLWVDLEVINSKIQGPKNDSLLSSLVLITRPTKVWLYACALEVDILDCKTPELIGCTGGAPNGCSPRPLSRF